MKRVLETNLPSSRVELPEGCSDLIDAYEIRSTTKEDRSKLLLRTAALLHDSFVMKIDPEILHTQDPNVLLPCISDLLHPILLSDPKLEMKIKPSSELVETLFHVLIANLEDET